MHSKQDFPKLKSPAILSPMSGVTDVAFRTLAKSYGAGLTYTEFVHSTALVHANANTLEMIRTDKSEKPVAVQLFGGNFDDIIEAAKFAEDKFDIIDINCGCPARKVIKTGAGSEMLKKPEQIGKLVGRLVDAVNKPVTVKIRKGINEKNVNAMEVAKLVEDNGAAAITVHGRTVEQGYSGDADWEIIKKVKEKINIPVIGNGDVDSPEIFKQRLDKSGVDYIMIARAAMGNPYIFKQINDYLKTGNYEEKDKIKQFSEYLKLAEKHNIQFPTIKEHAIKFTKGLVGSAKLRQKLVMCKDYETLKEMMKLIN